MTKKQWPRWCGDCHGDRPYGQEFCPACAGKRLEAEYEKETLDREREREVYEETDAFKLKRLQYRVDELERKNEELDSRMFWVLMVLEDIDPDKLEKFRAPE